MQLNGAKELNGIEVHTHTEDGSCKTCQLMAEEDRIDSAYQSAVNSSQDRSPVNAGMIE